MAVFKAFKPTAMNKIAQSMGYTGDMGQFQDFIEQDPARLARMKQFTNAAMEMAKGGVVKMQSTRQWGCNRSSSCAYCNGNNSTISTRARKSC